MHKYQTQCLDLLVIEMHCPTHIEMHCPTHIEMHCPAHIEMHCPTHIEMHCPTHIEMHCPTHIEMHCPTHNASQSHANIMARLTIKVILTPPFRKVVIKLWASPDCYRCQLQTQLNSQ